MRKFWNWLATETPEEKIFYRGVCYGLVICFVIDVIMTRLLPVALVWIFG